MAKRKWREAIRAICWSFLREKWVFLQLQRLRYVHDLDPAEHLKDEEDMAAYLT
jgi:hypothetical protein